MKVQPIAREKVVEKWQAETETWSTTSRKVNSGLVYAEAMLIAYNNKNKYRLPIKKLYGSQRDEELNDEETDDDTMVSPFVKSFFAGSMAC